MTSFHMILPSNSSMKTYPENTLNHNVTALSNRTELDGDWEVALSEISFHRATRSICFFDRAFISMDINWLIDAID